MPKGKNAAALFEVIQQGRKPEPGQSVTRTPKWWYKHASTGEAVPPAGAALQVDRDHHTVALRMSLATAITSGFAIVVLVVVAFFIGRHVGRGSAPMTAITSEQLLQSPPNPQVMDVSAPPAVAPPSSDENKAVAPNPAAPAGPMTRKDGLNYVIMQSYPGNMESVAKEAMGVLASKGVSCTIEPAPSRLRLPHGWISVVGTTGFDSISTSEFKTYVHQIEAANSELKGKFKKLTPLAYKW